MAFYVELPGDEYGNTAMPTAVFEGEIVQGGTPEAGYYSDPDRQALIITGPPEIRHDGMYLDSYGGFAETDGPARLLSRQEWKAVIASLRA